VLAALGAPTTSHVSEDFIETFGRSLERMRAVWRAPSGQPVVLAGSGTLAMDAAGANLTEPGDRALVLSTGVFGERFVDLLTRYGAEVDVVRAAPGETIDFAEVERRLDERSYKLMTATHVDTSTAVRMDAERFAALGAAHGVLTVLDGVCSVAGEEIQQGAWGLDVVLTASQKAIGVPPGLALLVLSPRALAAFDARRTPVTNYYADWAKWLPIMRAYEKRKPSYFGTPAVNLVFALDTSLGRILEEGMDVRFARHRKLGRACRAACRALGLGQIPTDDAHAANTLSAPRFPTGVNGEDLLAKVREAGAVLAGGLHPDLKTEYFRIGHMGVASPGDLLATIGAIEIGLSACGHRFDLGVGVAAAHAAFHA
jgi:alanine-glyoxylate transaminase/serine-glyoxylate transaminase/serine-pyruvate transaminase